MLARRTGSDLPDWTDTARDARLPGITGFAHGLTTDLQAVIAGPTVNWSSGGAGAVVVPVHAVTAARTSWRLMRAPATEVRVQTPVRDTSWVTNLTSRKRLGRSGMSAEQNDTHPLARQEGLQHCVKGLMTQLDRR
ncbi:hypothetical protein [Streptomyces sp. NBC_00038]|uniref:hypothetical protein n=1 Tax=Streptomyces sp. NBC_00038 TaxID=2903615 RepID=UPI002255D487|nr:hypothetical protein [Streptomyces sp. NBC_00038]